MFYVKCLLEWLGRDYDDVFKYIRLGYIKYVVKFRLSFVVFLKLLNKKVVGELNYWSIVFFSFLFEVIDIC